MSAAETWRVIFADGAVCFVAVERTGGGFRASRPNLPSRYGATAVAAIAEVDGVRGWDVAEVLAPGERSRAEMRADFVAERDALAASVEEMAVTWGALTPAEQAAVSGFAAHVASAIRARRTP